MQYGVISDIHGNLKALEAVWLALTEAGLSEGPVLNAGDNVGYGPAPEACVEFIRAHSQIVTVQGNYDRNVARFPEKQNEYHKKWARGRPDKYEALRQDSASISDGTRDWLLALPKEQTLSLGSVSLLLTHYAPGVKQGLGRTTSDADLRAHARNTNARVVVCGHTHSPFVRQADHVLFVNPGTVGRSWFGGPCYAVLTLAPGEPPTARLRQVKL